MDTTASTTGAGTADDEEEEEDDLEAELELLNEAASGKFDGMSIPHPNTPTASLGGGRDQEEVEQQQRREQQQQQRMAESAAAAARSHSVSMPSAYRHPVPILHHFSLAPPPSGSSCKHHGGISGKCSSPNALHHLHHLGIRPLPSPSTPQPPPATPTTAQQPQSLQLQQQQQQLVDGGDQSQSDKAMSRSISDSTLRRAALHLNLNQSVLPSFTSLQQFKVTFLGELRRFP